VPEGVFPGNTGINVVEFCLFIASERDVDPRVTPSPNGTTLVASCTVPVKLKLVNVTTGTVMKVLLPRGGRTTEEGFAEIAKSGRTVLIVRVALCTLVNPLSVLLPFTVRLKVPRGVLELVVTVRVDVPEPPEIVTVLKLALIPAFVVAAGIIRLSFTILVKPAFGVTVTETG